VLKRRLEDWFSAGSARRTREGSTLPSSCAFSVRCVICIESGVWLVAMIPPMLKYTAIVGMDALVQGFV
jgi:hypothetical protein